MTHEVVNTFFLRYYLFSTRLFSPNPRNTDFQDTGEYGEWMMNVKCVVNETNVVFVTN